MRSRLCLCSLLIIILLLLELLLFEVAQIVILSFFLFQTLISLNFGQKCHLNIFSTRVCQTDGQTDRRTDGRTDIPCYRDARTHLKRAQIFTWVWCHLWNGENVTNIWSSLASARLFLVKHFLFLLKNCEKRNKSDRVQKSDAFWRSARVSVSGTVLYIVPGAILLKIQSTSRIDWRTDKRTDPPTEMRERIKKEMENNG